MTTADRADIEAVAKAIYYTMHNIMHDHEKLWKEFDKAWLYRECAEAALLAASPARVLSKDSTPASGGEWRGIETVPHNDGEAVLLWADASDIESWTWHANDGRWYNGDRWWKEGDDFGPTHWLAIPAPPGSPASPEENKNSLVQERGSPAGSTSRSSERKK